MVRPSGNSPAPALDRVLEVDFQARADIGPALGPAAEARKAAALGAATAAEHLAEDLAQVDVFEGGAAASALEAAAEGVASAAGKPSHGLAPVRVDLTAIVLLALLRIFEQVERSGNTLEPLLSRLVAGVLVGVQLLRELAESFPDLVRARLPRDAEFLIRVLRQGSVRRFRPG